MVWWKWRWWIFAWSLNDTDGILEYDTDTKWNRVFCRLMIRRKLPPRSRRY